MQQYKTVFFAAMLTASLLAVGDTAQAELAVTFDRPALDNLAQVNDTTTLIGWSFTADTDLIVNKLGLWDWERDYVAEHNHFVGLWDSDGHLLTSVNFIEGPAPAHPATPFHMVDIAGVRLTAGQSYTVAAILGGDVFAYHTPTTLDPESTTVPFTGLTFNHVTYLQDAFAETDGLYFDNLVFGSFSLGTGVNNPYAVIGGFGANLDVAAVPLPSAAYLLGSALLGMAGLRRRKN